MAIRYRMIRTRRIGDPYLFVVHRAIGPGDNPVLVWEDREAFVSSVRQWAEASLPPESYRYAEDTDIFYFSNESAALAFKLRWS